MNCEDMVKMPELKGVLNLKAGAEGMLHPIRWIYFADCLQCVKNEYRVEDYIHGSEFVVLTNRSLTDDSTRLRELISKMQEYDIAALGINEGQISDEMVEYCNEHSLPLFELPEKFPLVDLSQIMCQRLVIEQNNKNSAEQLFTSILDAEHLNRENVFAQARFLNVDLSGEFRVIEFAYYKDKNNYDEGGYETGRSDRGMHREYHTNLYVYVHDSYVTLAERLNKIIPCKGDVKKTWVVVGTWLALGVFFYFYSKRKYGVEFGRDIFIVDENKNSMTENEDSHIAAINKKYEGKHFVVTVGCEYGSGGPEIAKMVADYFGIEYYNRDIVDKVVERKYSISEEEVRKEA